LLPNKNQNFDKPIVYEGIFLSNLHINFSLLTAFQQKNQFKAKPLFDKKIRDLQKVQ
jgi:hypothetical protein